MSTARAIKNKHKIDKEPMESEKVVMRRIVAELNVRVDLLEEEIELLKKERATVKWVAEQLGIPYGDEVVKVDTLKYAFKNLSVG